MWFPNLPYKVVAHCKLSQKRNDNSVCEIVGSLHITKTATSMVDLREELLNLTNPAPTFEDPEDELDEGVVFIFLIYI